MFISHPRSISKSHPPTSCQVLSIEGCNVGSFMITIVVVSSRATTNTVVDITTTFDIGCSMMNTNPICSGHRVDSMTIIGHNLFYTFIMCNYFKIGSLNLNFFANIMVINVVQERKLIFSYIIAINRLESLSRFGTKMIQIPLLKLNSL